ncbi:MAG: aminotransferase class I/II-fold pyridoxal phosphate-dependent enzyme [Chitinophagaceae bacterium]|nr:aminotransferase class I/II-fold pyridoxal phosphate-dependent enzyme [Oligoflexus sp.]
MSLNEVTLNLPNYPMEELAKIRQGLVENKQKVYDFGTGDPKIPTWEPIRKAMVDETTSISQYPASSGCPDLIKAIWNYCEKHFNVQPKKGLDVLATNGSKEAIFHIALNLVGRAGGKKIIAYPDPGYPVYRSSTLFACGTPYPIVLNEANAFQIEPWNMPADVQKQCAALWINYPHNPTGALMEESHLKKIIAWCKEQDVVLLADDCYIDIYDPEWDKSGKRPVTPIMYTHDNVIAFMSLSKRSGMTGYRSGFIIGDQRLMPAIAKARANMGVGTPTAIQKAAAVAWVDEAHVAERRKIFAKRIDLAYPYLHKLGMIKEKPQATFYLWCSVPNGQDDVEFCLGLAKLGVIASPSQWLSEGIKGYVRFALVPDDKDTIEAMEIIAKYVKKA